jgi:ABC-2 type transport system ATP-binding protein
VAVDGVDLCVPRGSAFGYLGPNGAGKTTLIRMLLGLTRATAGTMHLLGRPVPAERAAALARVGAIVEEPRFHRYLTGRENLFVVAAAREREAHGRIEGTLTERADAIETWSRRSASPAPGRRRNRRCVRTSLGIFLTDVLERSSTSDGCHWPQRTKSPFEGGKEGSHEP